MGTRGFRIVRYRGRYYCYYNGLDSYPESLGEEIRRQIPTDREKYTEWLIGQRRHYEDLHNKLKDYLSVRQYDSGEGVRENGRSTARPQMIGDNPNNTNLPSYMPEDLDEHDAAWAYIVDLDREVFTINNSAHMKLFRIPKHGWIAAIVKSASDIRFSHREKIILRGLLPLGCVTDLVLHVEPIATEILDSYNMLAVDIRAQGRILKNLLLGWNAEDLCFRELAHAILCIASPCKNLSLVRSRRVLDSPEAGYSDILSRDQPKQQGGCYYDGYNTGDSKNGRNVNLSTGEGTTRHTDGGGMDTPPMMGQSLVGGLDAEFVAHFGVGCHLQNNPPGTSPTETVYWFEGVLILLAVQLTRTGAVAQNVIRILQYHQQNYAHKSIDAIIISIEHVILLTVSPNGNVQHTEPLPLFALGAHKSKDASARYPAVYLETLERTVRHEWAKNAMIKRQTTELAAAVQKRKMKQSQAEVGTISSKNAINAVFKPERDLERIHAEERLEEKARDPGSIEEIGLRFGKEINDGYQSMPDDAVTETSFLSLVNFLESSARRNMRTATHGRLPTEIYRTIIANLPDVQTYRACMDVSIAFRDLCQQNLWIMDNLVLRGTTDHPNLQKHEAQRESNLFSTLHLATGIVQPMWFCRTSDYNSPYYGDDLGKYPDREWFKVVIGSQCGRRSVFQNMAVCLRPVEERTIEPRPRYDSQEIMSSEEGSDSD